MTAIAEELAKGQKEISVAEFFERNRQVLGFDSPTRALVTAVKEAVDNALDACEEAGILPDLRIEVHPTEHKDEYRLVVEDNGPGIVQAQMGRIFGQLLYGSRFHAIRQSRGQQGIGISAAVLYGQLTTGHRALVRSKIGKGRPCVEMEVAIDTKRNAAETYNKTMVEWDRDHGTRVEVTMKARYQGGQKSVEEYLRATSIVNPHARLVFQDPSGTQRIFERVDDEVPTPTRAIKPHPLGTELGTILKMGRASTYRKLSTFLQKEFVSVGSGAAKKILDASGLPNLDPKEMTRAEARALHDAFQSVKLLAPPTDCLSPIGEALVRRGLKKETEDVSPEYITTVTRPPAVWGGHPFQVEVGVVYGGTLPKDQSVRVLRFANRVPLLYQGGSCEATLAVQDVDWRRYGLEQRGGKGLPVGPALILVHVASTKVPFTSEAKEAIAPMEEIHKELRLALQEAARGLGRHLKKAAKRAKVSEKFTLVNKILPEIAKKSASMLGKPEPDLAPVVCKIMDVVWIDDPKVEYEKLDGQTLAPKAARPAAAQAASGEEGTDDEGDDTGRAGSAQVTTKAAAAKRGARVASGAASGGAGANAADSRAGPSGGAGRNGTLADFDDDAGGGPDGEAAADGDADDDGGGAMPFGSKAAYVEPPKPRQAYLGKVRIPVLNYRQKGSRFRLFAVLPDGAVVAEADPKPAKVADRYVAWDVPAMKPAERREIKLHIAGITKGDLDGLETYVEGINEMYVVGADPWHGGEE